MQEFFQITRYDLITEVLRNHKVFSNIHGTTVTVESYREEEQVLSFADPPRHTTQRRLLVSAFSPARVDAIGPHIQQVADDLIDRLPADGGTFELTTALGAALPVQIICEMLGVPMEDRDDFRRWSEISERAAPMPDRGSFQADLDAFSAYLAAIVAQRQDALDVGERPDDLITAIMTANVDGVRFTPTECVAIIRLVLSARNTTTTTLIANLVKALEEHPAERAKLLADLEGLTMSAFGMGIHHCLGSNLAVWRLASRSRPCIAGFRTFASLKGSCPSSTRERSSARTGCSNSSTTAPSGLEPRPDQRRVGASADLDHHQTRIGHPLASARTGRTTLDARSWRGSHLRPPRRKHRQARNRRNSWHLVALEV